MLLAIQGIDSRLIEKLKSKPIILPYSWLQELQPIDLTIQITMQNVDLLILV